MANIKENVYLNVYDLSNLNECLWNCGLGIYHTGIQIEDNEYSFGGIQGIYVCKPTSIIPLREKILLGQTNINYQKINEIIRDLQNDFYPERYHPTNNNCNHFTNALAKVILNKSIPSYVNRIPYFCSCLSCFITKEIDLDYKERVIKKNDIEANLYQPKKSLKKKESFINEYEFV